MSYDISVHIPVIYVLYDTNLFSNKTLVVILSGGYMAFIKASHTQNESLHTWWIFSQELYRVKDTDMGSFCYRYGTLHTRYRCEYWDQYQDTRYRELQQLILVSISDTISGDTRYWCHYSDGIPISGPESPDIGVNVYDQTVTAAAWIPQGFTKVMMRCS
jgi:hypothetical protein